MEQEQGDEVLLIKKITLGWVTQVFDTKTKKWIEQSFYAGDIVEYENEQGEPLDKTVLELLKGNCCLEEYLPFDMVQPSEGS